MENDRPPDHVISFRVFASSHLSPGFNKMTYHDILRHYIPWLQNVLFLFLYWTNFPFQPSNEFHALCKVAIKWNTLVIVLQELFPDVYRTSDWWAIKVPLFFFL